MAGPKGQGNDRRTLRLAEPVLDQIDGYEAELNATPTDKQEEVKCKIVMQESEWDYAKNLVENAYGLNGGKVTRKALKKLDAIFADTIKIDDSKVQIKKE
jgi:hypothetical protein